MSAAVQTHDDDGSVDPIGPNQTETPKQGDHHVFTANQPIAFDAAAVERVRINAAAVQRRARSIGARRTFKKIWQLVALLMGLRFLDDTTLTGADTEGRVRRLCAQTVSAIDSAALTALGFDPHEIHEAAACVYSKYYEVARSALPAHIHLAVVTTAFPDVGLQLAQRIAQIENEYSRGIREFDVVIDVELVLTEQWDALYHEVCAYRAACGPDGKMKVILSVGNINRLERVAKASRVAMMAGADCIKTSTGKDKNYQATLAAGLVMLRQIRWFWLTYGIKVGFKPAGGIRKAKQLLHWIALVKSELDDQLRETENFTTWLDPAWLRIGASSLRRDIEAQIFHLMTGRYPDRSHRRRIDWSRVESRFDPETVQAAYQELVFGSALENDARELAWISSHEGQFGHYIGGAWVEAGSHFPTMRPSRGEKLANIGVGTKKHVDDACRAAKAAFPSWSGLTNFQRSKFLYAIARTIADNKRTLAVLDAIENGKPIREAKIDVALCVRHFNYYARMAMLGTNPSLGVIACIIPWNFPLLMFAWKVAPALAAGNTVVLKPAETTSLSVLRLMGLLHDQSILPGGVLNIVTGDGSTGRHLVANTIPSKIAFTGSTEVGQLIREATAHRPVLLTMELGGKSPFIVCADADIDSAVEGVINAIFYNGGQVCCAGARIFVHESIRKEFMRRLHLRMKALRIGDSLEKGVDVGAINSRDQYEKISSMIALAPEGSVWQDLSCPIPEGGNFIRPTTIEVEPTHTLAQEEIFGPVVVVMSFADPMEAIALANETHYGLAASIWTQNGELALALAGAIKAGTVWINCTNCFDGGAGFGGEKMSGFEREGGPEGLRAVTHLVWDGEVTPFPELEAGVATIPMNDRYDRTTRIDRTYKFYTGNKERRPDGGRTFFVQDHTGRVIARVGDGNRKDLRDMVATATGAAASIESLTGHQQGQILEYLAEHLQARSEEMAEVIHWSTGNPMPHARFEVDTSIQLLWYWAAQADGYTGTVQNTATDFVVTAHNGPNGVMGIRAPDTFPLLGFVAAVAPAVAMGNAVVAIAGAHPLPALELIRSLRDSDVQPGALGILTAEDPDALAVQLAGNYDEVRAFWSFSTNRAKDIRTGSAWNMKRIWITDGDTFDWLGAQARSDEFLWSATQVKNVWLPQSAA